jgi:hypothetical protein
LPEHDLPVAKPEAPAKETEGEEIPSTEGTGEFVEGNLNLVQFLNRTQLALLSEDMELARQFLAEAPRYQLRERSRVLRLNASHGGDTYCMLLPYYGDGNRHTQQAFINLNLHKAEVLEITFLHVVNRVPSRKSLIQNYLREAEASLQATDERSRAIRKSRKWLNRACEAVAIDLKPLPAVENAQLNLQLTQGLIDIRALTPASLALQNAKVSLASVATLENQNQEPYRSLNQKVEELELALREATPGLFDRLQRIVK